MTALPYPMLGPPIRAATAFLADRRSADGLWRDFETLAGESCDWVSGFVAHSLGACGGSSEVRRTAIRALSARQRPNGGWAYNERVPTDCDSTAWVLMALTGVTVRKPSVLLRALPYLLRHRRDDGFATYALEDGIEAFIGADAAQTRGWRSAHPCVTALAVHALSLNGIVDRNVREAVAWLRSARSDEGLWPSYWWVGPSYATCQALRALAAARECDDVTWRRASRALLSRQGADGGFAPERGEPSGAFATAMSLAALLTRPDAACDDGIDRAARWLLDAQRGGRWPVAPILRIPRPMVRDPGSERYRRDALGTGVLICDHRGVFTAAAAASALAEYRLALRARRA